MVCTIPANAWTWLVRPRKASAVTMNDAGLDAGEGNPGSVIILQKQLGVGTLAAASSVGRGWSGSGWCSAPEFPNGHSCDMHPPSSTEMLEPNLVPAQWIRSAPSPLSEHCWFRPLCASSPVVVSGRSRCSARWMDPSYLVTGVGCWSAGAYIVGAVGHSYLTTLLPLWLTMPSYASTTPVVLAVRHASAGKGVDLTFVKSIV
ncbi:hypothetical protein B296_00059036 [Ensete ventricosum]|uniref:Uncharacterized protein n=1 Tax=Ensete ventricosum TaxID=4639 RepID=A0A426WVB0_ENSVE|nr:hypothetical protein B296_00059036 [Ensete ventricosum]